MATLNAADSFSAADSYRGSGIDDEFLDYVFGTTPSQPDTSCHGVVKNEEGAVATTVCITQIANNEVAPPIDVAYKSKNTKEQIIVFSSSDPPVTTSNDASTPKRGNVAKKLAAALSPMTKKQLNLSSNPRGKTSSEGNEGVIATDVQKFERVESSSREENANDLANQQPYLLQLSSMNLEIMKKPSLTHDYSFSRNSSGLDGGYTAWSYSAVGSDDETNFSIGGVTVENRLYDSTAFLRAGTGQDMSDDEPVISKPYFLEQSSSSYVESESENSGLDEEDNASTWSFSAVGGNDGKSTTVRSRKLVEI